MAKGRFTVEVGASEGRTDAEFEFELSSRKLEDLRLEFQFEWPVAGRKKNR